MIMKAVKKELERKYYKYSYQTWEQIKPDADGIIGTGDFAVFANKYYTTYYPYLALQNNTTDRWLTASDSYPPYYWGFWNKNPLCLTQMSWYQDNYAVGVYEIQGSNDTTTGLNGTWTTIYSSENTGTYNTVTATFSNTNYYKAYRIYGSTRVGSGIGFGMFNVQLTATERITTESTASDYDFYIEKDAYKMPYINEKYYAVKG